jgi:hypothetical protein
LLNKQKKRGKDMALKSVAKSQATMRLLKDTLQMRLKATAGVALNTIREARDAEGWSMLFISVNGNEAAEQPVVAVRCKAIDAVSKDVFGLDMYAFTPHVIEMAWEADAAAALDKAVVQHELSQAGMMLQLKEIAAESAVTAANMDAQAPLATLDWMRFPTKLG